MAGAGPLRRGHLGRGGEGGRAKSRSGGAGSGLRVGAPGVGSMAGGGARGRTGPSASHTPVLRSRCGPKPSEGVEQDRDVIRLGS